MFLKVEFLIPEKKQNSHRYSFAVSIYEYNYTK